MAQPIYKIVRGLYLSMTLNKDIASLDCQRLRPLGFIKEGKL